MDTKNYKLATKLAHLGLNPADYHGIVSPPVVRATTIVYKDLETYFSPNVKYRYGRMGNPASEAFEKSITEIEGGHNAITTCSGLGAVTTALLSFVKSGDHVLMTDACYPPTRFFCNRELKRMGVEVEYYDPCIGAGIENLVRDNTSVIYMESVGSATFEVTDVPAIVAVAKKHGIITVNDNTYSAGILYRPLEQGVDISLQSAAKYVGGHSDVNMGFVVAADPSHYKTLKGTALNLGQCAGSEDLYLSLRGLRTMKMRLKQAEENMKPVLEWFKMRTEVQELFSPILETARGHNIWKRDYSGANGVFGVLFKPEYGLEEIARFVDALKLFPVGSSWGGYESLIQPQDMKHYRSNWDKEGIFLRFQIGFEDPQDLIDDLEQGIKNIRK